MTFTIYNNEQFGTQIFDIEFWQERMDNDINLYYSKIRVTPSPIGIIDLVDRLIFINQFNKDELKADMTEIVDLGFWLYGSNNRSAVSQESEYRHYHVFLPHIKSVLEKFCYKYGLHLNED